MHELVVSEGRRKLNAKAGVTMKTCHLEHDQPPHPHDETTSTRFNRRYGMAIQTGPLGRLPIAPLEEIPVPVVHREVRRSQASRASQPNEPSAPNAGLNTRASRPREARNHTWLDFAYVPEVTLFLYYMFALLTFTS